MQVAVAHPRDSHTCSIGLKSGDFLGQSNPQVSSISREALITWVLCYCALSSTEMKPDSAVKQKREHGVPKPNNYTSHLSQCLLRRRGVLSDYANDASRDHQISAIIMADSSAI